MKEIRLLIESMQSGLVELFDELTELRKRLELTQDESSGPAPRILPLFSDISRSSKSPDENSQPLGSLTVDTSDSSNDTKVPIREIPEDTEDPEHTATSEEASSVIAKVSRVLDPIAVELKTGEASAEIVLEFLQTAKNYLIDDDPRKEKVARDIDVVLRFLQVRGKRAIREDERENILKRMERWKAHLVTYASSPVV